MTAKIAFKKSNVLTLLIPLGLLLSLVALVNSNVFLNNQNQLAKYVTIDFLITIPILYFVLIRRTKISNLTIAPFLILCVVLASYVLPTQHQDTLQLAKTYVIPAIEISVLAIVILKVRKAIKAFKTSSQIQKDFYTVLQDTCASLFPKTAAKLVANEIALIYYGFFNFKSVSLKDNEFSNYKQSGVLSTLSAFIFVVAIEMVTIHFIASKWSVVLAWVLTGLSIYSALQLIGIIRSVPKRPIQIVEDALVMRFGILSETRIPIKAIAGIEIADYSAFEKHKHTKTLSLLGELEQTNIAIHLKTPQQLSFIYGKPKTYTKLLVGIDQAQLFKTQVEMLLTKSE